MTENSNICSLPIRRTALNSVISRSMYTCFKIVNKLKSELLSYIIFEFFMWHYRKRVDAVIIYGIRFLKKKPYKIRKNRIHFFYKTVVKIYNNFEKHFYTVFWKNLVKYGKPVTIFFHKPLSKFIIIFKNIFIRFSEKTL